MCIKQEEYLPLAKDLIASFSRDLLLFAEEDHNYTQAYKNAFQSKITEVEQREASNTALVQQKQATHALYLLGEDLNLLKVCGYALKELEFPLTSPHRF